MDRLFLHYKKQYVSLTSLLVFTMLLMLFLSGCMASGPASSGASSGAVSSAVDYSTDANVELVGTWTGKLAKTDTNYACYGAQQNPIEITIHDIDSLGKMHVDVKVLFHGHARNDLTSDVESAPGDNYQEFSDLLTTLENKKFKLTIPESDIQGARDLEIKAVYNDSYSTAPQLEVTVKSGVKTYTTDEFMLTKVE